MRPYLQFPIINYNITKERSELKRVVIKNLKNKMIEGQPKNIEKQPEGDQKENIVNEIIEEAIKEIQEKNTDQNLDEEKLKKELLEALERSRSEFEEILKKLGADPNRYKDLIEKLQQSPESQK